MDGAVPNSVDLLRLLAAVFFESDQLSHGTGKEGYVGPGVNVHYVWKGAVENDPRDGSQYVSEKAGFLPGVGEDYAHGPSTKVSPLGTFARVGVSPGLLLRALFHTVWAFSPLATTRPLTKATYLPLYFERSTATDTFRFAKRATLLFWRSGS